MGIMKDNTNTYLLFGIIVCILIGCILILLKDKKVFKKNEMVIAAKDKLKHISKVKKNVQYRLWSCMWNFNTYEQCRKNYKHYNCNYTRIYSSISYSMDTI